MSMTTREITKPSSEGMTQTSGEPRGEEWILTAPSPHPDLSVIPTSIQDGRGFSEVRNLQLVRAALFLLLYMVDLTGNHLIIAVTTLYCSEMFIVTGMSYDRYVSMCCLLGYEVFMNQGACGKMAAAYWLTGNLFVVLLSASTFSLFLCGSHVVPQFFSVVCFMSIVVLYAHSSLSVDLLVSGFYTVVPLSLNPLFYSLKNREMKATMSRILKDSSAGALSLLKISCSENHVTFDMSVSIGSCLGFVCLFSIKASYDSIFSTVPRIPSADSQLKAFSICLPHLLVVTVFRAISAFDHLKPPSETSPTLDLLVSVFYTVVAPALNPSSAA
ncbi:olfactory receptor 14K1-like [Tachyglossus aculeatus]|uniref:olfactory receptor 14K1-like n=1 Tax=Tachyglossus aculeatus TaxID=9261 RepID=UPI0018F7ACAF|nr:olfactory receptor 14K1-like [Tachyglossus aculeatus]